MSRNVAPSECASGCAWVAGKGTLLCLNHAVYLSWTFKGARRGM